MRNPKEFTFESQGAGKKPDENPAESEVRSKIGSLIESTLVEEKAAQTERARKVESVKAGESADIKRTKENLNKLFDEKLQGEVNDARKKLKESGEQPLA